MAKKKNSEEVETPFFAMFWAILAYFNLLLFSKLFTWIRESILKQNSGEFKKGFAPLFDDYGAFYIKCIYGRINDCFTRPITSKPGPWLQILEREGFSYNNDLKYTGNITQCLNLGSYNYLGFADDAELCTKENLSVLAKYKTSTCSSRTSFGTTSKHIELERLVAQFVGKEDAVVFGMGFATNSTSLPRLVGKGGLIISDYLNHASVIVGIKSSAADFRVFRHNDMEHLEQVLRDAIVKGQPKTRKPWTKILIVVEGIYSMEGEICKLPEIIALKNKYKAYLYVDEAHSIGALGKRGGGVCDYFGIDTKEVDILMGTFTKSFGSAGGYLAGSKEVIDFIKANSFASLNDTSMSIPCVQQILTSMRIIMGVELPGEGEKRLMNLHNNSVYFRRRLQELGFNVGGSADSPIITIMLYSTAHMTAFSRLLAKRNIAAVIAGYPATPLLLSRARFCMSAAHNIEDIEFALREITEVGDFMGIRTKPITPNSESTFKGAHKRATVESNPQLVKQLSGE